MSEKEVKDVRKMTFTEIRDAYNSAVEEMNDLGDQLEELRSQPAPKGDEESVQRQADIDELEARWYEAVAHVELRDESLKKKEAMKRASDQFRPVIVPDKSRLQVREPDIYRQHGPHSFFGDAFRDDRGKDPEASERIAKHQRHALDNFREERATTSTTMGGLIPPVYLLDLYAKAARNGRVFADQCNNSTLPETGMSVIIPRITTSTAAAASQATENTALATSDPAETDLTLSVRTIGSYLPVSRQALERNAYDDRILFEDMVARYWAQLDTQAINGGGGSGTLLGALQTSGIATSTTSTATVAATWPKIADVIQQVNTNMGGIGYVADKIVMHPRRWGFFSAAVDTQNRPLFGISGQPAVNVVGQGSETGYGFVGNMHGLPVYTDANIPTNLGAGTNEDRIIVMASPVVHLFERGGDPVTVSFEQQAGTSLQVQLVCFGYAAFTAGRYPAATGVVSGAGLVTPTF